MGCGTRTRVAISSRVRSATYRERAPRSSSIEASFNDDLNGDGTVGVPLPSNAAVIELSGSTTLLTDGTYYYLRIGAGPAVYLSYGGAPVYSR